MVRKHPDVISKGATVNMSDVEEDPIVMIQRKWYLYLMALCCFIVPTLVPMWAWDESLWYAWHMTVAKYALSLNGTWSVNSAAHIWGVKPFD
ncbi:acyl- delta desaturase, partial [Lasius niger]